MKYEVYFDGQYIAGYFHTGNPARDIYELSNEILQSDYKCCWYLNNGVFLFDEEKKQRMIEEEETTPTYIDKLEAQVLYTAMMTDTLIEEGE